MHRGLASSQRRSAEGGAGRIHEARQLRDEEVPLTRASP
jgi:hypothetical protein